MLISKDYKAHENKIVSNVLKFSDWIKKHNTSENPQDEDFVYEEQVNAAAKILSAFKYHPAVFLAAQMQSGKTGVLQAIVKTIRKTNSQLLYEELKIDNTIFDNEVSDDSYEHYTKNGITVIQNIPDKKLKHQSYNRLDIPILTAGSGNIKNYGKLKLVDNTIIIIDEAHYGAQKQQTLDKVLKESGIEISNLKELKDRNIKILFVTATPFALSKVEELEANLNPFDQSLYKVILNPDNDKYYGITKMEKNGKLRSAYNFSGKNKEIAKQKFLSDVDIQYYLNNNIKKYFLIRATSDSYLRKFIKGLSESHDFKVVNVDATSDKSIKILNNKPNFPTFVFIKGMLRMGNTISTEHIYAVHDTAKSTNVDTVAQSLLGRCCGYNKEKDGVIIYTDIEAAEAYRFYVESGFDYKETPVGSGTERDGYYSPKSQFVIKMNLSDEEYSIIMKDKGATSSFVKNKLLKYEFESNPKLEDDIIYNNEKNERVRASWDEYLSTLGYKDYNEYARNKIINYIDNGNFSNSLNNRNLDTKKETSQKYLEQIVDNYINKIRTARSCHVKAREDTGSIPVYGTAWIDHSDKTLYLTWRSEKDNDLSFSHKSKLSNTSVHSDEEIFQKLKKEKKIKTAVKLLNIGAHNE